MKSIKSFLLLITCLLVTTNVAFSQSTDIAQESITTVTTSTIIAVKGITCSKDLGMISDNVMKLEGINSCEVAKRGATSKFEVKFNPALVTEKEIHNAIESTGSCENPNERPYKVKV